MEPITVIIWVCVIVFTVTACLTLLHVSGIYTMRDPEHGKALFRTLMLEIVFVAVAAFAAVISPKPTPTVPVDPPPVPSVSPPHEVVPTPDQVVTTPRPHGKKQPTDICSSDDPPLSCITGEKNEK